MKHLELFSGIGGFRRALDLISIDTDVKFETIGFSEIDKNAIKTYKTIFPESSNELDLGDIVKLTEDEKTLKSLPHFQFLTAGFPCQPFSMMGAQQGFKEDRGQMFFRILDILKAKKPKYILLENVKNLYTHDKGRTFSRIQQELELLGYNVISNIFNTADFHLPQKRNRVLIFATTASIKQSVKDGFNPLSIKEIFEAHYQQSSLLHYDTVADVLSKNVHEKYYLSARIKPTILADGSANFISSSEINQDIARPLTASMHKMHRACQDNYYSQDYIDSHGKMNCAKQLAKEQLAKQPIRRITPEEAFALQGFPPSFASESSSNGVIDSALYKQAGNAVSVNTIYAIVYYLILNKVIK